MKTTTNKPQTKLLATIPTVSELTKSIGKFFYNETAEVSEEGKVSVIKGGKRVTLIPYSVRLFKGRYRFETTI